MTTRRRVREIVLQVLYEDDMNSTREESDARGFIELRMRRNKPLVAFGLDLLGGIRQRRKEIDGVISRHASNWSIKRMATIDRNVLRIATFEMTWGGVPGRVAINEAVELAKRYGHHNSGPFVNGILDRILRDLEPNSGTSSDVQSDDSSLEVAEASWSNPDRRQTESTH